MKKQEKNILIAALVWMVCIIATTTFFVPVAAAQKRIFWVDSYQTGYEWSDGIERGIRSVLSGEDVHLEVYHMDTKACKTPECKKLSAEKAKKAIENFQPDILIASDDNAQKFLVVPFYKDSTLPVVFCGVNWDASIYGYPAANVTGMVEVELVQETIEHMKRNARGSRIGYISGKTESDRRIISWLNLHFFNMKMISYQVENFREFKNSFRKLQKETDMLFIRNYAGIEGWDPLTAKNFIAENIQVPTGSNNDFMAPYVVFTLGKIPEEQGKYAAKTALKIAAGIAPSALPIVHNRQARLTVNLAMADAADIVLPVSILKVARVIGREEFEQNRRSGELANHNFADKRVLWIDSYHKGYEWSDGIENGIREILLGKGTDFKIVRMNTKRKNREAQMKEAALLVRTQLTDFNPDIVIASDDNAQKYVVVPFLKNSPLPVVFCGVNWDASMYGYPAPNITGMVEVDRTVELSKILRKFAKGSRVGFLAGDVATSRKQAQIYNDKFFNGRMESYLARTQAELEEMYIQAQKEVDILFFSNYAGIPDWDAAATSKLVARYTAIPTGSHNPFMEKWVVCALAKSPEEQGRYAATTSLKILSGQSPDTLPLTTNKQSRLTINLQLAQKVGIVFPIHMLVQAKTINSFSVE